MEKQEPKVYTNIDEANAEIEKAYSRIKEERFVSKILALIGIAGCIFVGGVGINESLKKERLESQVSRLEKQIEVNHRDVIIDDSTQGIIPNLTVLTYPNGTQYAIAPSRNPNTGEVTCAEFKLNPHGNLPRWYH
jgi:hypothetical protein